MKTRRRSHYKKHAHLFEPVEPNWEYWIVHVVHWHALLLAIIMVVSIGYLFFNKQRVLAYSFPETDISSAYPQ